MLTATTDPYLILSPLTDRLMTLFAGVLLGFFLNRLAAARDRRRDERERHRALVEEGERTTAYKMNEAIHDAHEAFRRRLAGGDPGAAAAEMFDELDAVMRRDTFSLNDAEVRNRVEALGAVLGMSVAVEESDGTLDGLKLGYVVERAVVNARQALVKYSRSESLAATSFVRREEFPRVMWMVPPGQRWDRLLARLDELPEAARMVA